MITIWPGFWRFSSLIPWMFLVGGCVAVSVWEIVTAQPGEGVVILLLPGVTFLVGWVILRLRPFPIRLEITEGMVRARQGKWRGAPDMEVPRSEIRTIHYFPNLISFRGVDNSSPLMMIQPHYTLPQMRKVAAELHVRLYDHTRWLGLRQVDVGRLAYDPASGPTARLQ
jgi:hypothetical protein